MRGPGDLTAEDVLGLRLRGETRIGTEGNELLERMWGPQAGEKWREGSDPSSECHRHLKF